jgi:hypothetical protein
LLQHLVQLEPLEQPAVRHHGGDLPRVGDVGERVGIEQHEVRELASYTLTKSAPRRFAAITAWRAFSSFVTTVALPTFEPGPSWRGPAMTILGPGTAPTATALSHCRSSSMGPCMSAQTRHTVGEIEVNDRDVVEGERPGWGLLCWEGESNRGRVDRDGAGGEGQQDRAQTRRQHRPIGDLHRSSSIGGADPGEKRDPKN